MSFTSATAELHLHKHKQQHEEAAQEFCVQVSAEVSSHPNLKIDIRRKCVFNKNKFIVFPVAAPQ